MGANGLGNVPVGALTPLEAAHPTQYRHKSGSNLISGCGVPPGVGVAKRYKQKGVVDQSALQERLKKSRCVICSTA